MAVDAVRLNQDFFGVTLERARETTALFVKAGRRPGSYQLKTLDQVLLELSLTADQVGLAAVLANGEVAGTGCFGYVPRNDGPYLWPVDGTIVSCYGPRLDPVEGVEAFHYGVDIAAVEGTPVRAAHDGRVHLAAFSGNYGNLVILISGDGGMHTWYGHLSRFSVHADEWVRMGEVIGFVGSTGKSTGSHLHFETRGGNGTPENPTVFWRYGEVAGFSETGRKPLVDRKGAILGVAPSFHGVLDPHVPSVLSTLSSGADKTACHHCGWPGGA